MFQKELKKTAEVTGDFICNKIADKMIKVSSQSSLSTAKAETQNLIKNYKKKYISHLKKYNKLLMMLD